LASWGEITARRDRPTGHRHELPQPGPAG
jgi:hypothetical protein